MPERLPVQWRYLTYYLLLYSTSCSPHATNYSGNDCGSCGIIFRCIIFPCFFSESSHIFSTKTPRCKARPSHLLLVCGKPVSQQLRLAHKHDLTVSTVLHCIQNVKQTRNLFLDSWTAVMDGEGPFFYLQAHRCLARKDRIQFRWWSIGQKSTKIVDHPTPKSTA